MPSLTIKNVPSEVYEQLKQSAARNRRSLNGEAIVHLEMSLRQTRQADYEALMARIRESRARLKIWLTDDLLEAAKKEGRP